MENVKLSNLYFGQPDGTVEAKHNLFEELFYDPNNKYEDLITLQEKFMIIGSKGTGKTYLANYIVKKVSEMKNNYAAILPTSNFVIDKLSCVGNMEIDDELMIAVCKWYLLHSLAEQILKAHPYKAKFKVFRVYELKVYYSFFDGEDFFKLTTRNTSQEYERKSGVDINGSKNANNISSSSKCSSSVNKKDNISYESIRKDFFEFIPTLENKVLKSINPKEKFYVILDDLDDIDSTKFDRDKLIITLIKVAKEYNLQLLSNNCKFILLLRNDIIDDLQYKDANLSKVKTSCSVELYWLNNMHESNQYNHPLMSMILHKIKACCPQYSELSNKELFVKLFPDKIGNKNPVKYLLDYSFGRPRDFIIYLNAARELDGEATCFSSFLLKEASKKYSADFYDELVNQTAYYGKPEYTKECLQLVSSLKMTSFKYSHLKAYYEDNKNNFPNITNIDDVLRYLYKLGVIGNSWTNRAQSKRFYTSWSYKKDSMNEIDLDKKFIIHYGLKKKFSL